jgi:uncharacterized protein YaaN involved in tellurite resistance
MVNQSVQQSLKKFQENKTQEYQKTQKKINEIIEALNKHQTEINITISSPWNLLQS